MKPTTLVNKSNPDKPFYVPIGTRVTYSVFIMQRRKDLWGPDGMYIQLHSSVFPPAIIKVQSNAWANHSGGVFPADQFDPDRFLDHRVHKYLTPNPFIFVPFNAGPRICLGQQVRVIFLLKYL